MALVNHVKREINAKLVFYGPGLSGKGTNLNYIYRKLKPEHRGKLKAMNIDKERMLFFDFAPAEKGKVGAYDVRFHIYTIVGEVTSISAWKMVLKGADGVVFVADSAPDRLGANLEYRNNLQGILHAYGKNLSDLPVVLQCNKRNLPEVVPLGEMQTALNPGCYAVIPAIASKGEGVLESLYTLMKTVLKNLREKGLELDKESEQLASANTGMETERKTEPRGTEPVSIAAEADSHALHPESGETEMMAAIGGKEDVTSVGKPLLELVGEPELISGGRLLLPLNIKYGDWEKKFTITVSVSLEPDQVH
jgi:signal recognition particle receptor subunit beta